MKMSDLAVHVSKKPLPPHAKSLLVEVMVCDEEGEDVEMARSQAIIEALDGVKKFVRTIYTAVCLLTGLNSIRIQRTPYMRVALSPREILDLAAVTHPATCVLCVFRDR